MPYEVETVEKEGRKFFRILPSTGPGKKEFMSQAEAQAEAASLNVAEQDAANRSPDDELPSPAPTGPKTF